MRLLFHITKFGTYLLCLAIWVNSITVSAAPAKTFFRSDHEWSNENGWKIYKNNRLKGCIGEIRLSKGTIFLLGLRGDDTKLFLGLSNDKLDFAERGKTYKLNLLFDGKRGLRTSFNSTISGSKILLYGSYRNATKLRSAIDGSSQLRISLGKLLLASFSIKGSSATLEQLAACHSASPEKLATKSTPLNIHQKKELEIAAKLNSEAVFLYKARKYAAAEPLYRRALAIRENTLGTEHPKVGTSLNNLAALLEKKSDYTGAERLYRRSLAIFEEALGKWHPQIGSSLNNLAALLQTKGDYTGAEPLFRRTLAIRENAFGGEHPDVGTSLNNLASLLETKGDYASAEPLYRRALAILEKALGAENPRVGTSLNNLASLLEAKGDYTSAEPLYKRSLAILEKTLGSENPRVGISLNNLASLLETKGNYAGAEPLYRRALAIYEKVLGAEHPNVGTILNNLALLLQTIGDYSSAEPLYRRSLAISEKVLGVEHADVALSLNNLASLLQTKGDYSGAEPLYRRALAIREKALGAEHPDVGQSLHNLASLLKAKGDYVGVGPLYRRALAIYVKTFGTEHASVAQSLNNLASLLMTKGDDADAEILLRRALAIREKALVAENPDVGESLNNLAFLLNKKGDIINSLKFARRALKTGHPRRDVILSAIFASGNTNREFIAESFLVDQQISKSSSGKALQSLAVRFAAGDSELASLVRKEQDGAIEFVKLNKSILTELSKPPEERDVAQEKIIHDRIAELSSELKRIRSKLQREFPEFAELSKPEQIKLADAQALLKDDEVLVIIDVAGKKEGRDYVWAATSQNIQWRRLETVQGEIANTLTTIRAGLDLNTTLREPIDPAIAHELYRKLLGPVKQIFTGKKHLLFVLNGSVSSLPPQILVTKPPVDKDFRNVTWLASDYAITILPTVSSLKLLRTKKSARKARKPLRGYGDPVFDPFADNRSTRAISRGYRSFFRAGETDIEFLSQALSQLPGTGRELIAVGNSVDASQSEIVLGKAATETAVKSDKLDDYRIIYFATHGLVAGEVELANKSGAEPALAFSIPEKATDLDDGLLMASEVAQLKLNADWVVLSACNTAAGGKPGADALSGLARAFFYAGAKSLLVSHWVVDDNATAELMKRTFKSSSDNPNLRGAEALQQAMLSVMNDPDNPKWADPVYWAPFVLVGEPGFER